MMRWRMQRLVGIGIVGTAALGGALLWTAVAWQDPQPGEQSEKTLLFGHDLFYDPIIPSAPTILAAMGLAILLAAGVALLERRLTTRSRRATDLTWSPLSPRVVMDATRGVFAGPVTVTVLIPAHDEESCISHTLASLLAQDPAPDRVIVVADNCSDSTVELARAAGVEVVETVQNTLKKAGALNQVLRQVLPGRGPNDVVMVMDADTTLDSGFLRGVVRRMSADRALMAVGGLFYGEEGSGVVGQFQRNEYFRYQRELTRRRGRVFVLTGTATAFRASALQAVADARGVALPGVAGDVYDTLALTEDNELTIALKCLGALMISPAECTVVTEVMPDPRTLWAQRLRWQRGALENLGAYGMRPATMRYWAQQLGISYGVIALSGYLLMMLMVTLASDRWVWVPFWMGLGAVFMVERLVTVWRGGWRARLLAVTLFPELAYAMFLNMVYLKGIWDLSWAKKAVWSHVVQPPEQTLAVTES